MKIFNKIETIEPFPAIKINSLDLIAIADLHLGYETAAAEQGIFIPKIQYKKTIQNINKILSEKKAKRILINGDIKHEFTETKYHEYKEVDNLLKYLQKRFEEIIIIKGNHDTFISRITKKYDNIKLQDTFHEKDILFIHGHQNIEIKNIDEKIIILGHEHPSIALYTDIGIKEKTKCFLFGKTNSKNVLVMPAFSYFAQGSDINILPKNELLSPILKKININQMRAIGIIENEKHLLFPKIKNMRD